MGTFEFVSFNEEEPDEAYCSGKLVFKYNGQLCKTSTDFIAPHNTWDICHYAGWSEQDIHWGRICADISDADKPLFLVMFVEYVVPVLLKCTCCSRPSDVIGSINATNKHIQVR